MIFNRLRLLIIVTLVTVLTGCSSLSTDRWPSQTRSHNGITYLTTQVDRTETECLLACSDYTTRYWEVTIKLPNGQFKYLPVRYSSAIGAISAAERFIDKNYPDQQATSEESNARDNEAISDNEALDETEEIADVEETLDDAVASSEADTTETEAIELANEAEANDQR